MAPDPDGPPEVSLEDVLAHRRRVLVTEYTFEAGDERTVYRVEIEDFTRSDLNLAIGVMLRLLGPLYQGEAFPSEDAG